MPRINAYSLPRDRRLRETKDFPIAGEVMTLTLEEPDPVTVTRNRALRDEMIERYLTGNALHPAFPFEVDGEAVALTSDFIAEVATVVSMQPAAEEGGEPPYTWEELAQIALRRHREWREINGFALRVLNGVEERQGEEPGAPTDSSSVRRSSTATPTLSFAAAGTPPSSA